MQMGMSVSEGNGAAKCNRGQNIAIHQYVAPCKEGIASPTQYEETQKDAREQTQISDNLNRNQYVEKEQQVSCNCSFEVCIHF